MLGMCASGPDARLALALLCALAVACAHDKRAEMSPVPFTFAARYGRSPERFITPRNDRWLMTTRYGKRSDTFTMEEDSSRESHPTLRESPPSRREREERGRRLSCEYTGVLALYRCTRRQGRAHERTRITRRSEDDDPAPSDEE